MKLYGEKVISRNL